MTGPVHEKAADGGEIITAAAVVHGRATFVRLHVASGFMYLLELRHIEALADDQRQIQSYTAELREYVITRDIDHLYMRVGPGQGPKTSTPLRLKLEFLTVRTVGVPVTRLASQTVAQWKKAEGFEAHWHLEHAPPEFRSSCLAAFEAGEYAIYREGIGA